MSNLLRIFQTSGDPVDVRSPTDQQIADVEKVMKEQKGFFEFDTGSVRTIIAGKSIIRIVISAGPTIGSRDYA